MKFQPETSTGVNTVSRQQPGRVWVAGTAFDSSLLLPWTGPALAWPVADFEELTAAHFGQILGLKPEIVIFGSGLRLRFPAPALLRSLIEQGIGVETMDTAAACRTYNVLVSESRSVVAALLLQQPGAAAETL